MKQEAIKENYEYYNNSNYAFRKQISKMIIDIATCLFGGTNIALLYFIKQ